MSNPPHAQYLSPPDAEEVYIGIDALHRGQEQINIAIVELSTTVKHLVAVSERQADFGERMAVMQTRLDNVENGVKDERAGRKADIRFIWGMIIPIALFLGAQAFPHMHWK